MSPREVKQVWQNDTPSICPKDFLGNSFQSGNWEHSLDSFFRDSSSSYIWSATQIKATGKHFDNPLRSPQPKCPCVRNPWPILKIRKPSGEEEFLNKPCDGCSHEAKELVGPDECRCKTCASKDDDNKTSGELVRATDDSAATSKAEIDDSSNEYSSPSVTPDLPIEGPPPVLNAEPQNPIADGSSTSISSTGKLSEDVSPASNLVEGDSPLDATRQCQTPENANNELNTMGPDSSLLPLGDPRPATTSEDAALEPSSQDHPVSPCDIPLPLDSDEDSNGMQASVDPIEDASVNSTEATPSASGSSADIVSLNVHEDTLCSDEDKANYLACSSAESPFGMVTSEIPVDLSLGQTHATHHGSPTQTYSDVTTTPPPPSCEQRDDCHIVDAMMESDLQITELSDIDASWNPHATKDKNIVEVEVRAVMTPFSSDESLSLSRGDSPSDHASRSAETPYELRMSINGNSSAKLGSPYFSNLRPGTEYMETAPLLLLSGGNDETQASVTEQVQKNVPQLDNMALTTEGDLRLSEIDKQEVSSERKDEVKKSSDASDQDSTPSPSIDQIPLNSGSGDGSADPDRTPNPGAISAEEEDFVSSSEPNAESKPNQEVTPTNTEPPEQPDSEDPVRIEPLQAPIETTIRASPKYAPPVALNEVSAGQPTSLTPTDVLEPSDTEVVVESLQNDAKSVTPQSTVSDTHSEGCTTTENVLETSSRKEPAVTLSPHPDNTSTSTETTAQPPCPGIESYTPPKAACEPQVDSTPNHVVVPEPPKKELPPWNTRLIAQQFPFYDYPEVPYEEYQSNLRAMVSAELPFFTEIMIPPLYKTLKELQSDLRAKVSAELPFFTEGLIPLLYTTPNYSRIERPQYDPLYIKDLPNLEEFIPKEYLPDTLIVHDSDQTTRMYGPYQKSYPYRRQYPKRSPTTKGQGKIGHIYLGQANKLGSGHWSNVYKASFKLPSPLTAANSPNGHVIVAAKLHDGGYEAKDHLRREGIMYSQLPECLMQDYCGYATFHRDGNPSSCRNPVPLGPVVPKFYGYYVPENNRGGSPILLLEHCGKSLAGRSSSIAEKEEVISLYARLHDAGFLQGSAYRRNMLVQPGPLTVAPESRSMDTPSYRLIDFGRGEVDYYSRDERCEYEDAVDHIFNYTDY
ncbi:hypothetical protein PC9H_005729 [Pleurotus ostreatus]|uniref:Protein kinase domain-containing protein n=1 Tax=Pleurotus ostreatus TaxID=5322 RepID=A0A8H7DUM5_PLEOS|nr:uncharacterized protein PC9H_005729 [Pleurotus ostreatus]KAF7433764.1 hypothetical protein PC9H_005729 [Pleurotus ostreatus]KAJ8697447.1 hypothetical protein PTI98_004254 [Pleurotus ostreatus]